MPSMTHEVLVDLFRNRPSLAAEILDEVLDVPLPTFTEARIASADLTQIQPAEYRADAVVALRDDQGTLGVLIVEVQLAPDPGKRLSWPVYVSVSRAVHGCPAFLLVVAPDRPSPAGARNRSRWAPQASSCARPFFTTSLGDAARRALEAKMIKGYEYQSDFAKKYVAEGRAEEKARDILTVLRVRGITVPDDIRERILAQQDLERLERWLERAIVASSLAAVLDETN